MKSPPRQVPDSVAKDDTERFIAEHVGAPKLRRSRRGPRPDPRQPGLPRPRLCWRGELRALRDRPGIPLRLGRPSRGQPLRRAAVRRALCPRAPGGRRGAGGLPRACARVASAGSARRGRSRGAVGGAGVRPSGRRRPGTSLSAHPSRLLGRPTARPRPHARGPPRERRARLRSRTRALRPECGLRRAPPLARAQRGDLPRASRAGGLDAARAALHRASLRAPRRTHGEPTRDRRARRPLLPRRLPGDPAGRRPRRASGARRRRARRDHLLGRGGAGALRTFLRALRRLPPALPWRATVWSRSGERRVPISLSRAISDRIHFAGPEHGSEAQHLARAHLAVAASSGVAPLHSSSSARSPAAPCP